MRLLLNLIKTSPCEAAAASGKLFRFVLIAADVRLPTCSCCATSPYKNQPSRSKPKKHRDRLQLTSRWKSEALVLKTWLSTRWEPLDQAIWISIREQNTGISFNQYPELSASGVELMRVCSNSEMLQNELMMWGARNWWYVKGTSSCGRSQRSVPITSICIWARKGKDTPN